MWGFIPPEPVAQGRYTCRRCATVVVMGEDTEIYSADVKDQSFQQLCTEHWRERQNERNKP